VYETGCFHLGREAVVVAGDAAVDGHMCCIRAHAAQLQALPGKCMQQALLSHILQLLTIVSKLVSCCVHVLLHVWVFVRLQLKFKRYLACARNKLWWMTPEWGSSLHTLPPETQFLLLQLDEKQQASSSSGGGRRYAVVLPLIDGDWRATCRPNR
jgi:hypothetical protein